LVLHAIGNLEACDIGSVLSRSTSPKLAVDLRPATLTSTQAPATLEPLTVACTISASMGCKSASVFEHGGCMSLHSGFRLRRIIDGFTPNRQSESNCCAFSEKHSTLTLLRALVSIAVVGRLYPRPPLVEHVAARMEDV
jgi:hypothetical protein